MIRRLAVRMLQRRLSANGWRFLGTVSALASSRVFPLRLESVPTVSCLAYSRVRHLSEWLAGITVLVVAYRAESVLVAMVVGVGTLLVIRGSGGAIVYSSLPGSSATVSTAASTAFTAYSIRSCASAALISGPITPNVTGVSLSRLTSLSLSAAVWVTT